MHSDWTEMLWSSQLTEYNCSVLWQHARENEKHYGITNNVACIFKLNCRAYQNN